MPGSAPGRRQPPWRAVAAGAAAVFCVALAYVAGRMDGGGVPAATGAEPAPAPAQTQPDQSQDGSGSARGDFDQGSDDQFQVPQDQAPSEGEPPVTRAS